MGASPWTSDEGVRSNRGLLALAAACGVLVLLGLGNWAVARRGAGVEPVAAVASRVTVGPARYAWTPPEAPAEPRPDAPAPVRMRRVETPPPTPSPGPVPPVVAPAVPIPPPGPELELIDDRDHFVPVPEEPDEVGEVDDPQDPHHDGYGEELQRWRAIRVN